MQNLASCARAASEKRQTIGPAAAEMGQARRFDRPLLASDLPPETNIVRVGGHVSEWESGRIEARIGLRMMPTFPRSPLSFRTAGFPQYGWKAGFPSDACLDDQRLKPAPGMRWPTSSLTSALRAPRGLNGCPALCLATGSIAHRRGGLLLPRPQGPSLKSGL